MNKIILDEGSVIKLNVIEDSICNIKNRDNLKKLDIFLDDNVTFMLNEYSEINKRDYEINIYQNNNSVFIYNHSFMVKDLYNLNINVFLNGNKSINTINIHGINDFGRSNIILDGCVNSYTVDNTFYENIKVLNLNNGKSLIKPIMYINSKNVCANHSASITDVDDDYLFYMNTRGISDDRAKELIIDAFLDNDAR